MAVEKTFKKYGEEFNLMELTKSVCLYSRSRRGKVKGYEVMIITYRPPVVLGGKQIPGGDSLPSASQWGVFGWSFLATELKRATKRYHDTVKLRHNIDLAPARVIVRKPKTEQMLPLPPKRVLIRRAK